MYNIGTYQELDVDHKGEHGYYLKATEAYDEILLPFNEIIGEIIEGDRVRVFIYLDNKDRLVATMKTAYASVGELAYLKLVSQVDFGAFFDIGLQRDLFVPKQETNFELKKNHSYLIRVYLDKSDRLCGSTKVYDDLQTDHSYKLHEIVKGTVIRVNPEVGVYVALENKYKGMVPIQTCFLDLVEGQVLDFRIIRIREDNKIDLSTQLKIEEQLDADAEKIYAMLNQEGGRLNYHDKSEPEKIKKKFQMSKKAFKRAVGRLLKENKIEIYDTYIEKK